MTARMRRLAADYEQIKKDFTNHKNIIVTAVGPEPPEHYHVTYFVNGIYLLPDGRIETLGRHEVDIELQADYPRYKPLCRISTPIWHPNFRDGQICIGDIWGAGESLSDIIINIGDMIQYKSWNSFSPLSADAAQWAIENKYLFPVGDAVLSVAQGPDSADDVEIDLFDEMMADSDGASSLDEAAQVQSSQEQANAFFPPVVDPAIPQAPINDFDITEEDLAGIEYIPTDQRIQSFSHADIVKSKQVNFKTILVKGLIWGLIGGIVGFILNEILSGIFNSDHILGWMGYTTVDDLLKLDKETALNLIKQSVCLDSSFFSCFIAVSLGLFLGVGEGVYYGSAKKAVRYGMIGAAISLVIGFGSGYVAQLMYSNFLAKASSDLSAALIRGLGWGIMGIGVGLSAGLIKPEKKRLLFCVIGGGIGGFIGGFLFNFITEIFTLSENDTGIVPRAVGIILMGLLIGLLIGLLEQFAKAAWLKVIRGEFEGKEYLVFSGTTSIGNDGTNSIVLFKDKLVSPHHCDIVLENNKYSVVDAGSPMGTIVNGMRVKRQILKQGDAIAIGNTVLIFNLK